MCLGESAGETGPEASGEMEDGLNWEGGGKVKNLLGGQHTDVP